jgi:hypothetical protein
LILKRGWSLYRNCYGREAGPYTGLDTEERLVLIQGLILRLVSIQGLILKRGWSLHRA